MDNTKKSLADNPPENPTPQELLEMIWEHWLRLKPEPIKDAASINFYLGALATKLDCDYERFYNLAKAYDAV